MVDVTTLTADELDELRLAVIAEQVKRQVIADAPAQANEIAQRYSNAVGRSDGQEWVQPLGAFDAYPTDAVVEHAGKSWTNITPANVWEPGVSGWREVVAPGGLAEWVQPTGAHDAYTFGDKVAHNGHAWTNTNPGDHTNTWEPGVYGWADDGITP